MGRVRAVLLAGALSAGIAACGGGQGAPAPPNPDPNASHTQSAGVLDYRMQALNGKPQNLSRYVGKVVLIVNTATECGFTPQFKGLEALYRDKRKDGFVILGFPSNDFGHQEPRSNQGIAEFCKANYGVSFPMFAKLHVAGAAAHPLFKELSVSTGAPGWNFNKYLLDRHGFVRQHFGVEVEPKSRELTSAIDGLLKSS